MLTPHASSGSPAFKQLQSALGWQGRFDDIKDWAKDVDHFVPVSPCPLGKRKRTFLRSDRGGHRHSGLLLSVDEAFDGDDDPGRDARRNLWPDVVGGTMITESVPKQSLQRPALDLPTASQDSGRSSSSSTYHLGTHLTLRNKGKMAAHLAEIGPCRSLSFFFKSPKQVVRETLPAASMTGLKTALSVMTSHGECWLTRLYGPKLNRQIRTH